jgi:hypothetical protein
MLDIAIHEKTPTRQLPIDVANGCANAKYKSAPTSSGDCQSLDAPIILVMETHPNNTNMAVEHINTAISVQ